MKTLEGWIIKYNKASAPMKLSNGRTVTEYMSENAFKASVDAINAGAYQIEANIEHNQNNALNRIALSGQNLKLENRSEGVYFTCNLSDETVSNDIFEKARAGIVTGLSIEFDKTPGIEPAYSTDGAGNYTRTFKSAILKGFAITAKGFYPDAQITSAVETVNTRSNATVELETIVKEIATIEHQNRLHKYYQDIGWLYNH